MLESVMSYILVICSDLEKKKKKQPCDCSIYSTNQDAPIPYALHAKSRKGNDEMKEEEVGERHTQIR